MTSSIRDLIFGEEITLFEALDQLEVTSLYSQIDELTIRVDLLDDNLRSLATTVDTNHRQTQLQIQDLTTSIVTMQADVALALSNSTTANNSAASALITANEAIRIANLTQIELQVLRQEVSQLRTEVPRFLRGGMTITMFGEQGVSISTGLVYILPSNVDYIMSHTQYHCATPSFPNSFVQAVTFAGAGDNSRNGITTSGILYRIREGANQCTYTNNALSLLREIRIN